MGVIGEQVEERLADHPAVAARQGLGFGDPAADARLDQAGPGREAIEGSPQVHALEVVHHPVVQPAAIRPEHGLERPHGALARALYGEPTGRIQPDGYPERSLRWALQNVEDALRGLAFGTVTLVVQDGVVVQVERTERRRFHRPPQ